MLPYKWSVLYHVKQKLHMDGLDANFCLIVLDYDFHDATNTTKKKIIVQDNKTIIGLSKKQSLYSLQLKPDITY